MGEWTYPLLIVAGILWLLAGCVYWCRYNGVTLPLRTLVWLIIRPAVMDPVTWVLFGVAFALRAFNYAGIFYLP